MVVWLRWYGVLQAEGDGHTMIMCTQAWSCGWSLMLGPSQMQLSLSEEQEHCAQVGSSDQVGSGHMWHETPFPSRPGHCRVSPLQDYISILSYGSIKAGMFT